MEKTAHTPGPWSVDSESYDGPNQYAEICAGDGASELVRICDIPSWPAAPEEMRANAHLLSAAPELLDACRNLLAIVRIQNGNLHDDVNAIQAAADLAIAKAEGRTHE